MALMFMITVLPSRMIITNAATEPYEVQTLNNTGIMFEDLGKILLFHDTWNLFTQINISDLEAETTLIEHTGFLISQLCRVHNATTSACTEQNSYIHSLIESIRKRTTTIREMITTRHRRSLFDGIGSGLHYLFGTMDASNEKQIYSKIANLETDTQALLELEKHQITLFKSSFEKLRKPINQLETNQRELTKTVNDLLDMVNGELNTRQRLQEVVATISLQVLDIELRQQTFIQILTALKNNQVHPLLLSPSTLLETYHKAHPKDSNSFQDLAILTQAIEVKSGLLNNLLVIRITFPILNMPPFKLQQIHLFPFKTPDNHSLVLDIKDAYIASHISTQEFVTFKQSEFRVYKKVSSSLNESTYIGPLLNPILQGHYVKECPINFLFNPYNETGTCDYLVQTQAPQLLIKLTRKNSWLFSFPTTQKITISCRKNLHSSNLFGSGVLILNEPCHFQIADQIIYFEDEDHQNIKISQPEYPHPLKSNMNETIHKFLNNITQNTQKHIIMLKAEDANNILNENSYSLDQLEEQIDTLDKQRKERNKTEMVQISSLSLSSVVILLLSIIGILKLCKFIRNKKKNIIVKTPKIITVNNQKVQLDTEANPQLRIETTEALTHEPKADVKFSNFTLPQETVMTNKVKQITQNFQSEIAKANTPRMISQPPTQEIATAIKERTLYQTKRTGLKESINPRSAQPTQASNRQNMSIQPPTPPPLPPSLNQPKPDSITSPRQLQVV